MNKQQLVEMGNTHGVKTFKSWKKAKIAVAIWNKLGLDHQSVRTDIDHHSAFAKSYPWEPPGHASNRRLMEDQESFLTKVKFNGLEYSYESSVNCSCRHVYYKGTFAVNGDKKNVTLWKDLRTRIFAEMVKVEKEGKSS